MRWWRQGKQARNTNVRHPRITDHNEEYSFRRSRTLTGSASSQVSAAGESRAQIKSSRLKEHELRTHRNKLFAYFSLSVIALAGLYGLLSQFVWSVTAVESPQRLSAQSLDEARYQQLVEEYFAANPLERFRFVLRERELNQHLRRALPEVQAAEMNPGDGFMTGRLQVEVRRPILVWEIAGTTYYVDDQGAAFTRNHFATPPLTVKDNSGIDPEAGAIASNRILRFIGRTVTLINRASVPEVAEVSLPPNMTRQIDLKLRGKPYIIKTQLDRDPAGQAADVVAAVAYFERRGITPRYIDVRVNSQAFYRE